VWATTGAAGGGYAERTVARAETLLELPATLAAADAVTVGSSALVAHFALRHAHFDAGESVLIRGAAGGIGVMAVQLAAAAGAGTIAVTTSSPQRGERLRALGATHVLDRDGGGTDGPGDYDVVLDIVAGPRAPAFLGRLGRAGRMVFVGIVGGPPADLTGGLFAAFQRSLSVATFSLDVVDVAEQRAYARDVLAAAARGELRAAVHDVLALDRVAEAHQLMDDGAVFGRLVLVPEVA
jgi:NADPH:quinone reductase-like Zn-dependent oxidoreductase